MTADSVLEDEIRPSAAVLEGDAVGVDVRIDERLDPIGVEIGDVDSAPVGLRLERAGIASVSAVGSVFGAVDDQRHTYQLERRYVNAIHPE